MRGAPVRCHIGGFVMQGEKPPNEKPLNQMLLELNEKVPNAIFSNDNTGEDQLIEDMRAELEANPEGGPLVITEVHGTRGVWSLLTLEEGYSGGLVGTVFKDTGGGEPSAPPS